MMVGAPKVGDLHCKGQRGAPRPGLADLEVEDAGVALLEALPVWHHAVQERLVERQRRNGRQQPAVTWEGPKPPNSCQNHPQNPQMWGRGEAILTQSSLADVGARGSIHNELWARTQLLRESPKFGMFPHSGCPKPTGFW